MMTTIGNEYHVTGGQSATDNSSVGIFHVPSMLSSILRRAVSRIGSAPPRPAYLQKGEQLRRQAAQWYDAQTSSVSARPLAKQALANVILAVTASLNGTATQALRANRRVRDVLTSPMLPQDAQQELSASWPGAVGPDAVSAAMQDQLFSVPDDHIVVQSNDSVQLFLEQQGYKTDDVLDATLLCKAAVDALVKDPQVAPSLARHILKGLACYGGSIREPVSGQYQAAVIRRWVELQLFEGDIEAFIAADWPCRQVSLERELADLGNLIRRHIFAHLLAHDTEAAGYRPDVVLKSWIWNKVVLALVPVLRYVNSEQDGGLPLRGSEWGHINAGLLFAQRAGLELDDVSLYQALDLGKMLHLQLAGEVLPIECRHCAGRPVMQLPPPGGKRILREIARWRSITCLQPSPWWRHMNNGFGRYNNCCRQWPTSGPGRSWPKINWGRRRPRVKCYPCLILAKSIRRISSRLMLSLPAMNNMIVSGSGSHGLV